MAEGVNYALAQGVETGSKIPRAEQMGLVRTLIETYADGGEANTVVYLGDKLPNGAIVLGMEVICNYADASLTLDIGDADDIDRYADGLDASSAINGRIAIPTAGVGYVIGTADGDNQLQVKLLGATASGAFKIVVYYSI